MLNVFRELLNVNLSHSQLSLLECLPPKFFQQWNWSSPAADNCFKWAEMLLAALCEVWLIGAKKPQVEVVIWSWPGNRLLYLVQLVSEELPRTTFISIRAKHLLACLLYHSHLFPSSSSRYARLSGTPKTGIKHSPHSCSSCKCRMNVKSIVFRVSVAKNPARITVKDNLDTQSSWDDDRSAYFQF